MLAECQDAIRSGDGPVMRLSPGAGAVRALRLRAVTELLAAALLEGDYARAGASDRSAFRRRWWRRCEHLDETAGRGGF